MRYNIIGDIHGRDNWKKLVREDCINVFVGDYFSPYFPYPFEDQVNNFMDIIMYKVKHPETILLIGNHDEDHWHIHERYSRFDAEHFNDIKQLFEENEDFFQLAYSIEDKVLVTHAGVSAVWYIRQKYRALFTNIIDCNYDEEDEVESPYSREMVKRENPIKYSLAKSASEAWNMYNEKYKPAAFGSIPINPHVGQIILWNNRYWFYFEEEWQLLDMTPDKLESFINNLWREGRYSAFNFHSNCGPYDGYGNDDRHGPLWIRPDALMYCDIFKGTPFYQVAGHTQENHIFLGEDQKVLYVDVLGWNTQSLIVEVDKGIVTFGIYESDKV